MDNVNNAAAYIEAPLKLDQHPELDWQDQADVVVVGYGGAGVCAALEARAEGADVLAIERFEGGGATTLSGGIVYGGGTPYQQAAGIEDSAEEMYKYLKREIGDVVRDETLHRFCDGSADSLAWLTENGLAFGSTPFLGKRSYPPKGYDLYYSGNEAAPSFADTAKAAPRGHRVVGTGYTGEEFFDGLNHTAQQKGVRVRNYTRVNRLVVDSDNRVVGVEVKSLPIGSEAHKQHVKIMKKVNQYQRYIAKAAAKAAALIRDIEQQHSQTFYIKANKAVILTTGSFAFNPHMVSHYAPKYKEAMPLGTISCDGSGVLLGQSVGGDVGYMDSVTAWRSISPSENFVKAMVVNRAGKRFIAEDAYLGHLGRAMADQEGQRAWLIIDSHTYWSAYKEAIPKWGEEGYLEFRGPLLMNLLFNTQRGKTLSALANKIGVDAAGLEAEVVAYNDCVAGGKDPLQKKPSNCRALGKGSYYAIDISVGSKKFNCPVIPMGGLRVDEDTGQVLKPDNAVVDGLYAAGRAAVGIPSGFYVSGSSLADCVFSGRRAGRCAAQLSVDKQHLNKVESV